MSADINLSISTLVSRVAQLMGLPKDYKARLKAVQINLRNAYDRLQLDVKGAVNSSGQSPVDYFLAQAVANLLKSKSDRSIFGGYKGDAAIWDKIVLAYQRKGLWTVEAAQQIVWCVEFELPRLRKTASLYDQQLQALGHRHADTLNHAQAAAEQYTRECAQAGLEGDDVAYELGCAIAQLPHTLQAVLTRLRHQAVQTAIDAYSGLCLKREDDCLSATHVLLSAGCGAPLQQLPDIVHHLCSRDKHALKSSAQFPSETGVTASAHPTVHAISILDDTDIFSCSEAEGMPPCAKHACRLASQRGQDEWNIAVAASGTAAHNLEATGDVGMRHGSRVQLTPFEGHPGAQRLAFDANFRKRLTSDLHELRGHLSQRSHEEESVPTIPGYLPWECHGMSREAVHTAMASLSYAIQVLDRPAVCLLMRALESKEFTDRFVRNLQMQLMQSKKFRMRAAELLQEQTDIRAQLACIGQLRKERLRYSNEARNQLQATVSAHMKCTVHVAAHVLD